MGKGRNTNPLYKPYRSTYESNRKKILATEDVCYICGKFVDKKLKFPHPMSATVDHVIPLSKGGSNDLDNLRLAHNICNRLKSDDISNIALNEAEETIANDVLPLTIDWRKYKAHK